MEEREALRYVDFIVLESGWETCWTLKKNICIVVENSGVFKKLFFGRECQKHFKKAMKALDPFLGEMGSHAIWHTISASS